MYSKLQTERGLIGLWGNHHTQTTHSQKTASDHFTRCECDKLIDPHVFEELKFYLKH